MVIAFKFEIITPCYIYNHFSNYRKLAAGIYVLVQGTNLFITLYIILLRAGLIPFRADLIPFRAGLAYSLSVIRQGVVPD